MTGVKETDSNESLFIIKEGLGESQCETGAPIKCDSVVRFEHIGTGKNLHSHNFPSFITESQEVCGYGDNGIGDMNDNFQIQCYNANDTFLKGKTNFLLKHLLTNQYLYINIKKSLFNEYNCRGCPIINQREVSCTNIKDKQSLWKIIGGIIFSNNNEKDNVRLDNL